MSAATTITSVRSPLGDILGAMIMTTPGATLAAPT